MRAVVQRVSRVEVTEEGHTLGAIRQGLLVLLGVEKEDSEKDVAYLARKILNLRIFEDPQEKMNLSVLDIRGELCVVSQFTLLGDCRKGNRPSFVDAASPEKADLLYELFLTTVRASGVPVASGRFQACMEVSLVNQGPVTILMDSRKTF